MEKGSASQPINPINNQEIDTEDGWGINTATKLILEGIAEKKEDIQTLKNNPRTQKLIGAEEINFKSLGLNRNEDVVIATSDQPAFKLIPEIFKQGNTKEKREPIYQEDQ